MKKKHFDWAGAFPLSLTRLVHSLFLHQDGEIMVLQARVNWSHSWWNCQRHKIGFQCARQKMCQAGEKQSFSQGQCKAISFHQASVLHQTKLRSPKKIVMSSSLQPHSSTISLQVPLGQENDEPAATQILARQFVMPLMQEKQSAKSLGFVTL